MSVSEYVQYPQALDLAHLNGTQPSLMLSIPSVLFPASIFQNVCREKGQLWPNFHLLTTYFTSYTVTRTLSCYNDRFYHYMSDYFMSDFSLCIIHLNQEHLKNAESDSSLLSKGICWRVAFLHLFIWVCTYKHRFYKVKRSFNCRSVQLDWPSRKWKETIEVQISAAF